MTLSLNTVNKLVISECSLTMSVIFIQLHDCISPAVGDILPKLLTYLAVLFMRICTFFLEENNSEAPP